MTENHGYRTPQRGSTDWHTPLNDNFRRLDADIEVRDTEANRTDYTPRKGAKFLATDTGAVFIGDGSTWNELGRLHTDTSTPTTERSVTAIITHDGQTAGDDTYTVHTRDGEAAAGTAAKALTHAFEAFDKGTVALAPGDAGHGRFRLYSKVEVPPGFRLTGTDKTSVINITDGGPCLHFKRNSSVGYLYVDASNKDGVVVGEDLAMSGNQIGYLNVARVGETGTGVEFRGFGHGWREIGATGVGGRDSTGLSFANAADVLAGATIVVHCGTGIDIRGGGHVFMSNVDIDSCTRTGLRIDDTNDVRIDGTVWVNDSVSSSNMDYGVRIGPANRCTGIVTDVTHDSHSGVAVDVGNCDHSLLTHLVGSWEDNGRTIDVGVKTSPETADTVVIRGTIDASPSVTKDLGGSAYYDVYEASAGKRVMDGIAVSGTGIDARNNSVENVGSLRLSAQDLTATTDANADDVFLHDGSDNHPRDLYRWDGTRFVRVGDSATTITPSR